jgi:hypothetical protein
MKIYFTRLIDSFEIYFYGWILEFRLNPKKQKNNE